MSTQQEFVALIWPHALRVSEMTGLDPRLVVAQAAQETGWGRSAPGNNFFGIKSHGRAGGATYGTHEYVNGQRVNIRDSFRTYDDVGQSAEDYANFLMANPRYREMLAAEGLDAQVAALGRSGYATDPNYAHSVMRIASGIDPNGQYSAPSGTFALRPQQGRMTPQNPAALDMGEAADNALAQPEQPMMPNMLDTRQDPAAFMSRRRNALAAPTYQPRYLTRTA
jgi:hypothetical protein